MAITNDPFYDPHSNYGWTGSTPYRDTPLADVDYNNVNQQGYFTDWLTRQGYGGTGTQNEWARGLWNRINQGYDAARTQNTTLKWTDYLPTVNLGQIAASMSPTARGESPQRYVGPLRYEMRQE